MIPRAGGTDVDNNRAESKRCAELRIGRHTGRLGVSNEFLERGVGGGEKRGRLSLLAVLITDTEGGSRKSTLKSLAPYVKEHFANAAFGVYPIENDSKIAIIVVANKYSPNNYWYVT